MESIISPHSFIFILTINMEDDCIIYRISKAWWRTGPVQQVTTTIRPRDCMRLTLQGEPVGHWPIFEVDQEYSIPRLESYSWQWKESAIRDFDL